MNESSFSSPAVSWTRIDDSSWSGKLLKASNILLTPAWLVPSRTLIKTTCSIPCWKSCHPHLPSLLGFFHFLPLPSIRDTSSKLHQNCWKHINISGLKKFPAGWGADIVVSSITRCAWEAHKDLHHHAWRLFQLHLPLLLQSLQLSIPADPPTCACPLVTFFLVKSELNCFGLWPVHKCL